jgi:hypothetical protein
MGVLRRSAPHLAVHRVLRPGRGGRGPLRSLRGVLGARRALVAGGGIACGLLALGLGAIPVLRLAAPAGPLAESSRATSQARAPGARTSADGAPGTLARGWRAQRSPGSRAPGQAARGPGAAGRQGRVAAATARVPFRRIILPDVVAVEPRGLTGAQVARLARLPGVRHVLAVDGARITIGGRRADVIGVDPQLYRPWTPLPTASSSRLWSALGTGEFVVSPQLRHRLGLRVRARYRLVGTAAHDLVFGGAAQLGVAGIDLMVSSRSSASLGLIHNVAAFVSAPGLPMRQLLRKVRAVVGQRAAITDVRPQRLTAGQAASGGRPATYFSLFRQSAARYCPGLSWTVLAAIGQIESGDGANPGPSPAGALGPMQFLPSTWERWGITAFGEPGPPNVMDPYDAVPSAARYLCAAGAATPGGLPGAIFAYNHAGWYVREVLALAQAYARQYG